jgi:hypothetical protein
VGGALLLRRQKLAEAAADDELTGTGQTPGPKVPTEKCAGLPEPWATGCKVGGSLFNFLTSLPASHSNPGKLVLYYDSINRKLNGQCLATTRLHQGRSGSSMTPSGPVPSGYYHSYPSESQSDWKGNASSTFDPDQGLCILYGNLCAPFRGCNSSSARAGWRRCRPGTRSLGANTGDWGPPRPNTPEATAVPPFRLADNGDKVGGCLKPRRFSVAGFGVGSWGQTARDFAKLVGVNL